MLLDHLLNLYLREIATLERELELYPDDDTVWAELTGLPNTAGTLFLHLAGSLQHFFGAVYGETGYVRDREAEFSRRGVPRSELRRELAGARAGVQAAFTRLREEDLARVFPVRYADEPVSVQLTLLQFLSHLAFHLGQIDYHRRAVTGHRVSAGAVDPAHLRP
ncbi:DinB family protein [Deinococcus koreensis]|nr:DinB family protein [Deinococcus koreensis]